MLLHGQDKAVAAADPDLPRLSDVLSIYKRGRASGRQTDWLRSELAAQMGGETGPLSISVLGSARGVPPPPLFSKKALYKLLSGVLGQHFSVGHWGWDHPGQRCHWGTSRLADVSRVALN